MKIESTQRNTELKDINRTHFDPVYLNLFTVDIPTTEEFNYITCQLLSDSISECSIDIENRRLILSLKDNYYFNNEMFVYSKLLLMKYAKLILPLIDVNLFDRKGDVYLSYSLYKSKIIEFDDVLNLSYKKGSEHLEISVVLEFEEFDVIFLLNQETDLHHITNSKFSDERSEDPHYTYIK